MAGQAGQEQRAGRDQEQVSQDRVSQDRVSEHYFTASPAAAHRPGLIQVVLPDLHFECATDAGVFSGGRLDPGTRVLLETVPPPPARGDLLDLGTGYGPVALAMAARAPGATVWAVDVNERALELCAANAARAGLGNVRCVTPEAPGLPGQFAAIWSNPPIRVGKQALHEMLASWLGRLAPGGQAHLVVQRNLGADSLQRWLQAEGWPASRIASRSGYRVLQVAAR
ncbi:MAG: rRNA (guanine1207-N2)-methyltransferase [Streptosporangiaceae bacterium]|nr:rRNA (guanine1207-N2)-methyltransferase [Streptosporangiaceae bacterium]